MKWFIRAARQGDKTAQHNLGLHYASIDAGVETPKGEIDKILEELEATRKDKDKDADETFEESDEAE
jgi:TPR repeat protein